MGKFLEKVVKDIASTSNKEGVITNVKGNLEKIGEKGGIKYCALVDKVVDIIFKK